MNRQEVKVDIFPVFMTLLFCKKSLMGCMSVCDERWDKNICTGIFL